MGKVISIIILISFIMMLNLMCDDSIQNKIQTEKHYNTKREQLGKALHKFWGKSIKTILDEYEIGSSGKVQIPKKSVMLLRDKIKISYKELLDKEEEIDIILNIFIK